MVFTVRFMFCFVYVEKVKIMRRQVIDWGKYLQKIKDLKKKKKIEDCYPKQTKDFENSTVMESFS